MVKEENINYHNVNKFIVNFLNNNNVELINEWKDKSNLRSLKNILRKTSTQPNPPRPKNAYIYFCEEMRPVIQDEMRRKLGADDNQKISINEVTCMLGNKWREFRYLPDDNEDKKRIFELAEKDSDRYKREKASMEKREIKRNHLTSKYLFFCNEERERNKGITFLDISPRWAANKNDAELTKRYEAAKLAVAEANK